ncbi:hypothetical protein P8X24_03470 [Pyrococcus kukulkanii]|uniref:hypothetical protein n=1 Tax=Pyrococcus kukulkanii TaxID=1609559 RepID=UPI0035625FFF
MVVKPDDDALRRRVLKTKQYLVLSPFSPKADELLGEEPVVPMNPTVEANLPHPRNSLIVITH